MKNIEFRQDDILGFVVLMLFYGMLLFWFIIFS